MVEEVRRPHRIEYRAIPEKRNLALSRHRNWKFYSAYVTREARDKALAALNKKNKSLEGTRYEIWQYRASSK